MDIKRLLLLLIIVSFGVSIMYGQSYKSLYSKAEKLYEQGDYDSAIDYFRKAFDANKKYFNSFKHLIYCFEKKNDVNAIITEINSYFKNNSMIDVDDKAFLYAYLAKANSQIGKLSDADDNIEKSIKIVANEEDKKEFLEIKKQIAAKKMEYFSAEFKKAEAFYNSGNSDKAISILRALLNIDRSDSRVASLFSKIQNEIAIKKKSEEIEKMVKTARALEGENKWEDAKYKWDEILGMEGKASDHQKEVDAFIQRWTNFKKKKKEEADRAQIEANEKKMKAMLIRKANTGYKNEDWNSTADALEKLRQIEPHEQRWQTMYEKVKQKLKLISDMEKGLKLLGDKEYDQAISLLEEVYNADKKSRHISKALADAYFEKQRYNDSAAVIKNYLGNSPTDKKNSELYKLLSKSYINGKEFEKAQVALNDYISLEPNDVESKYILTDLYIDSGKYDKAEENLKSFADIQEQSDRAFQKYRKLYEKKFEADPTLSNFEELIKVFKIRLSMYTNESDVFRKLSYELGKICFEREKFPEAYVHLDNAIMKMSPEEEATYPELRAMYNKCWFMRYMIYFHVLGGILLLILLRVLWVSVIEPVMVSMKEGKKENLKQAVKKYKTQKKYDKVVATCKEIITKFPMNVSEAKQTRGDIAEAYLEIGKYDDAEKEAKDLLKLERNFKTAHRVIAMVHFKRGEYPQSIAQCRLVFDFDISEPSIHTIFQNSYKALDNKEELIMEYEDMIQMNPDNINLRNIYLKLQNEFLTDEEKES